MRSSISQPKNQPSPQRTKNSMFIEGILLIFKMTNALYRYFINPPLNEIHT
jgi:hypothetical protein